MTINPSQGGVVTKTGTSSQGGVSSQLVDSEVEEIGGDSPGLKSLRLVVEGPSKSKQDKQKRVITKPVRYIETCFGFALTLEDLSIGDVLTEEGAVGFALAAARVIEIDEPQSYAEAMESVDWKEACFKEKDVKVLDGSRTYLVS
ncbi:unnamed protein product [Arabis nemorensis]|uniref:Uncharacterized protein n=1 Tax=Arabis nemorensis TaxID=586526 RepID=A0A565CBE6_9BRAS|nr:unnamed protein product [Arabis nemorensis]